MLHDSRSADFALRIFRITYARLAGCSGYRAGGDDQISEEPVRMTGSNDSGPSLNMASFPKHCSSAARKTALGDLIVCDG